MNTIYIHTLVIKIMCVLIKKKNMSKIVFGTGFKDSGQKITVLGGEGGLDFKQVNEIVIRNRIKTESYTKKTEHGEDISTTRYLKNDKQMICLES